MKSKHIGLRLGMAFAVLIAMLVGNGQSGLRRMKKIDESLSDITGRRSDKLQLAREALTLSNRNSRITMEIFLVQDRAQTGMLLTTRAENTKKISKLVAEIASRCESEKEKQRLSAVEGMRKPYIDSYLRALHLLLGERERDAAVAVMVNETLPALVKYHAAWEEFVDFQKDQMSIATKQANVELPAVSVAVNVSAVQFRQAGFCELIRRVLHETGLAPQYLELELTESLLLSNEDVMFSVLQELKAMGLKLAIDDFGTGYSSLSYLKQFPVGRLKIDRSFIRDIAANPDDAAITTAIISLAKSLNLKVIAEGVEDEAQMTFLRAHQCDEIQGYYFSKPLAVDKVADKLRGTAVHALSANHGV